MIKSISAEILKLKSSKISWTLFVCAILTVAFVFIGHLLDVNNIIRLNVNPWVRYANASLTIYSLFILSAIVVLITSFVANIENKSNGWKLVYTMPVSRWSIYSSKFIVLVLLLIFNLLLLYLTIWISGFILAFILPEYEFSFYQPEWSDVFARSIHAIISVLGVIGIQYFLTIRFRNFLVPLGVGIFGLIFGFILSTIDIKFILYCPYSLSLIHI